MSKIADKLTHRELFVLCFVALPCATFLGYELISNRIHIRTKNFEMC